MATWVTPVCRNKQVISGCQGNSTRGSAAGERLMGKWFTGCCASTSTSREPSVAAATRTRAARHGNASPWLHVLTSVHFMSHIRGHVGLFYKCVCPLSWVTGNWEDCSASCGQSGWQRRWVSCQQESSRGQQQRSVHSKLCLEDRPDGKQTCNRVPCPAVWRAGPWTPVRSLPSSSYTTSNLLPCKSSGHL